MKVYQFDTETAAQYGVDQAIMIWNFQYWIEHNEHNGMHFHDGRFWTYNSVEAFTKTFPFWSKGQIRRILNSLIDAGVLMTGNFNQSSRDRTTWYAFTDSFRNQQMHLSKSTNGNAENEKCNNIESNTRESKIHIENTDKAADGGLFPTEPAFETITVTRPRRTAEPAACLFENSRFAEYNAFAAEFTAPEFADVDMVYYYHAVADWSAQKGKKMKDWIATARNFIRGDMEKGKLHRKSGTGPGLSPDALKYLQDMAD